MFTVDSNAPLDITKQVALQQMNGSMMRYQSSGSSKYSHALSVNGTVA
jgi:hypothetical protein